MRPRFVLPALTIGLSLFGCISPESGDPAGGAGGARAGGSGGGSGGENGGGATPGTGGSAPGTGGKGGASIAAGGTGGSASAAGGSSGGSAGAGGGPAAGAGGGGTGGGASTGGTSGAGGSSAGKDAGGARDSGAAEAPVASGSVDWTSCGPLSFKPNVSAADFCAQYMKACSFDPAGGAAGASRYKSAADCMMKYSALSDGPMGGKACVAYHLCLASFPEMSVYCHNAPAASAMSGPCKTSYL
jgi:hypothetical protein